MPASEPALSDSALSEPVLPEPALSAAQLAQATVPLVSRPRLRMWQRFFLSQVGMFTLLTLILAAVQFTSLNTRTRQEYGERALMLSRAVAQTPGVISYFTNPALTIRLDPLLERIRAEVGADFLVVGGRLGMRYAHPFPDELARRISAQPGADDVLAGGDPVEVGVGQFRDFIWGKADILNAGGQTIGVVSTGFLLPTVQAGITRVMAGLLPWYGFGLLFALLSSLYLSRRLRRDLFDLEPAQIAGLVAQHHAVLGGLRDGLLVLSGGRAALANPRALALLGAENVQELGAVQDFWPELAERLDGGGQEQSVPWRKQAFQVSSAPLPQGQQLVLFRERAEAVRLAEELTQTREYVSVLRSQSHEFTNRLHTIAGLLQIGRPELALQIIQREADEAQQISDSVSRIQVPEVAALLAGKIARARELGVRLWVNEASALDAHWSEAVVNVLTRALGNLIENAFDAVRGGPHPTLQVMLGEDTEGLQLEVRDNGPGIAPQVVGTLFQSGVTTKGHGRGQGLHLVQRELKGVRGQIEFLRTAQETVFIVSIPRPPEEP